jgi:hypothetical protein
MGRWLLTGTLSLLSCLNHLSSTTLMAPCSGFQNSFIHDLFSQRELITYLFPFPVMLKTVLSFMTVAMSLPVNSFPGLGIYVVT